MRLNQNILLLGKKVVLVPYTAEHVPRYHEWMKSEELQRLTASEPLTLEQEYAMQRSWREDADKCTFIVLDAERWRAQPGAAEESCMAGDVNLFLTDLGDPSSGEVEIMIAEPSCRGRGFGTEAVLMMMSYGVTKLGLTKFEAKIGQENEPSIRMFQKLHFEQVAVSSVFQEVTLRLTMSEPARQWLLEQTSHVEEKPYGDGSSEPHGLSPATRGVDAPGLGAEGSPPLSRLGVPFWDPSDSGSALSRPPSDWQCLQGSLPPGQA